MDKVGQARVCVNLPARGRVRTGTAAGLLMASGAELGKGGRGQENLQLSVCAE